MLIEGLNAIPSENPNLAEFFFDGFHRARKHMVVAIIISGKQNSIPRILRSMADVRFAYSFLAHLASQA
jgi:hypothetical protein